MVPDADIWRAASLLIKEYGDTAELTAARRADEMLDRGEPDGQLTWLRIRRAVIELQAQPAGPPH